MAISTLDQAHPGDGRCCCLPPSASPTCSCKANPKAKLYLFATWSRADQTYPDSAAPAWHGKPIQQMGKDVEAGL